MKLNFLLFCLLAISSCNTNANGDDKNNTPVGPVVKPTVDFTDNGEFMRVVCRGEDVYVSAALDATSDILYHFRKCMANDIFTFYTVGCAKNNDPRMRLEPTTMLSTTFNSAAASDNIGPFWFSGNYFVGGNHKWSDDKTKTASTESWSVKAGDKVLSDGDDTYAKEITITVVNNLYDPYVAPSPGASMLSEVLAKETVVYTVMGKSLKVSCSQEFKKGVEVYRYYGMQSMFMNETRMMTPGAKFNEWTDCPQTTATITAPVTEFPDLNIFVERNSDKYFQTAYLSPEGLGSHKYVSADHPSYIYANYGSAGNGKAYHVLIGGHGIAAGEKLSWDGTYVWGQKAKVDDSDMFCHEGRFNGRRALYIFSSYPATRTIKLEGATAESEFEIFESKGEFRVTAKKDALVVDAATSGYAIVCY